ncbi:MAG: NINE protein [Buchananella hordeovulneris]|nr:NINE protein [Buchananella hordeovulneris]
MSANFPPGPAQGGQQGQPAYNQPPQGYGQPGYGQSGYGQPGPAPYGGYQGAPVPGAKSKVAAGVLGILLGGLGIHNFYLGHTGKALAQLLISVLSFGILSFVSVIWGVVEGILILTSQPGTEWHRDANGVELLD